MNTEWRAGILRSWHLSMLRFAVTRDNADRLAVLVIANEIDGLGRQSRERPDFGFFRKTSAKLCAALLRQSKADETVLRQYLMQIDDFRLKRAFAAVLEMPAKRRSKPAPDLWRGLPARGDARH